MLAAPPAATSIAEVVAVWGTTRAAAVWFSVISAIAAVAVNWTVGGTAITVATAGTLAALSWLWAAACGVTAGAAVAGALDQRNS